MAKIPKEILEWRARQKRGAIMRPATFAKIEKAVMARYGISRARARKIAGKAYWKTVKARARKAR